MRATNATGADATRGRLDNAALRVRSLTVGLMFAGAALLGAACGGGASPTGPAPAPAPAPAPPPLQPLAWEDVPEEAVVVFLGERSVVDLRLTPAVEATYAVSASNERITVSTESPQAGVVEVAVMGLETGESAVEVVATASGYETATASFSVRVEPPTETGSITEDPSFGCREFTDYDRLIGYSEAGRDDEFIDALSDKARNGECGFFDLGDRIDWAGEERTPSSSDLFVAIRVWGRPQTGPSLLAAERSQWWTPKVFTTFAGSTVTYTDVGSLVLRAAEQSRAAIMNSAAR